MTIEMFLSLVLASFGIIMGGSLLFKGLCLTPDFSTCVLGFMFMFGGCGSFCVFMSLEDGK